MKTNVKARFIIAILVSVVCFMLAAFLPRFQEANYAVVDNVLLVDRQNPYNTSVVVEVIEVDAQGNMEEHELRVEYDEGATKMKYDEAYFQQVLNTDNNVLVKGTSEKSLNAFSYYEDHVAATLLIIAALMVSSAVYLMFKIMDAAPDFADMVWNFFERIAKMCEKKKA